MRFLPNGRGVEARGQNYTNKVIKRKRICPQIDKSSFYDRGELAPCPTPPRVVLRGVGKIQIPHAFWFFFATEKEHLSIRISPIVFQCSQHEFQKHQAYFERVSTLLIQLQ